MKKESGKEYERGYGKEHEKKCGRKMEKRMADNETGRPETAEYMTEEEKNICRSDFRSAKERTERYQA